ncbi:MAG: protoporphyrinogen oxidase [Chloroflexi bacterium]|nr:protoporphyrinogen oxidase [Chloroflexota bacterium]
MKTNQVDANTKRIVIIGGGAAGLAGALAVKRAAEEGHPVDWILLEKDSRLGGKILTEKIDDFIVDGGPDCFLSEKPWMAQMAARVGITDRLLGSNEPMKRTFIYAGGRFHDLPDGVMMMVPTKFLPFATTSLFSWPGKIRMGLDLFLPVRKDEGDETLASFVRRRLGRECLDRLAEPMVAGVHASDPEHMSLRATFPRFLQMERKYRSLILGFLAARRNFPKPPPPKPGSPQRTYFMTFRDGMQEITDAVADAAGRDRMLTGRKVTKIEERAEGARYAVHLEGGRIIHADAVILSAEAYMAATMLNGLDRQLAQLLETIPYVSAGTVSLAYRRDRLGHDLHGFGFLVPSNEKRKIMASTWSSTKWIGRAPEGHALIRVFVGGAHNQALVELDDEEIIRISRDELRTIMGISAEPEFARVYRWIRGMPQYTLGHLQRLETMEERLAQHPGLYLCGASYRGVGTGDCMNSAEQAVAKAIEYLGATPERTLSSARGGA